MENVIQFDGESPLKVRLFVQGFAPNGAEAMPATIYDRLERLEAAGAIDDCEVEVWGRKVCRRIGDDRPTIGGDALELIEEFRAWADRADASLDRCFAESEVHSEVTGEDRREVRLPVACLAVYEGESLTAVYPHAESGEERTVMDGLDRLADGDWDDHPAGNDRTGRSGDDRDGQSGSDRNASPNRRAGTIRH